MAALQFTTPSLNRLSMANEEHINQQDMHLETPLHKKLQHDEKVHKNNNNAPIPGMTSADGVESDAESVQEDDEEEDGNDDESDEPANTGDKASLERPTPKNPTEVEEIWNNNAFDLEDIDEDAQDGFEAGAGDEGGDEDELAFNVDDDDYGDLEMDDDDNASVSTDDSKKFEAEVEHELEQLGVEGIDWDDENTYAYSRMPGGSYAIDVDLTTPDSVFELEIFRPDAEAELFAAEAGSAPNTDIALSQIVFSTEWPVPSDSEAEEDQAETMGDGLERRVSAISQTSDLTSLMTDTGYETDEEDIPEQLSISSPGLKLTRTPQRPGMTSDNMDRRITDFTPRRRGLQPTIMKNLPIRQKKAIAYTVREPYGNVVHFKTPKNSKLRWISIRTRRESSESDNSPASPTMVDLDNALMEGNTRTGAHISDAINGRLFQQYHCTQLQLPEPLDLGDSNLTEFARNPMLMGSIRGIFENALAGLMEQDDDIEGDDDDEFHAFFDIEGGFADDTTSTPNPTPISRTASFAGFVEEEEVDSQLTPGDADDEDEEATMVKTTFSSPLKRRASNDLESMSPELKRKKLEIPASQSDRGKKNGG